MVDEGGDVCILGASVKNEVESWCVFPSVRQKGNKSYVPAGGTQTLLTTTTYRLSETEQPLKRQSPVFI